MNQFTKATCALAVMAACSTAVAQNYPTKPVRIVVGSATAASTDILARMVAGHLPSVLKGTYIVENKPGAGGTFGYQEVFKAAPDAHTVAAAAATFMWSKTVQPDLPLDPATDMQPVSQVTKSALILIVHPSVPVNSVKELIAYAKANPGKLNVGVNNGTVTHLSAAYFKAATGTDLVLVPYKGSSAATTDLVAGRIQMHIGGVLSNTPRIKAGKVRALGVTTLDRNPVWPDVPSISETVPGYEVNSLHGWLTTKGSPMSSVNALSQAIAKVMKVKEVNDAIVNDGSIPFGSTVKEFEDTIKRNAPVFQKIARESNMGLE